ncbi:MAG: flagellar protein FlgN [Bacillota bacterium]|nr:flagellar protein FlgN [Bacillota bacterium]
MNKSLELLLGSLDKANEIYAELLEIATKKRALINDQKMDELEKLVNHEMGLVGALYKLEDIRGKAVKELVEVHGFKDFKTISELAVQLPDDERRVLMDKKNKLLVGIRTVSEETKFNSKLLEDKIALIDLSIQMLTEDDVEAGYGEKERKSIFDVRI